MELCPASGRGENSVTVEALAAPVHSALLLDLLPGEAGVVAHAASGDALPLEERVMGRFPTGIELIAHTQAIGKGEKDVEVGASFAGRGDHAI